KSSPLFSNIDLQFHFEEGDYRVKGNPVTLGQVSLNLLLNAAQVQPNGGEVRVEGSTGESKVVIKVIDRGPGISEEAMSHLFEPFYSGRSSTGLGLSLCLGIIRQHGGSIKAENRPKGGASFMVTLPALRSSEKSA
ncbi:MAG TPA: HAMP domain-containing sensor histidine kinase, partial [Acidobacteriota bacterium]|nr:HAMP domain-containing sensor histidine kinase [Acidobacteriota bacterium]